MMFKFLACAALYLALSLFDKDDFQERLDQSEGSHPRCASCGYPVLRERCKRCAKWGAR